MSTISMSTTSVWVRLYIGQQARGTSFEIKPMPSNISALRDAVKGKCAEDLVGVSAQMLQVYGPDYAVASQSTDFPVPEEAVGLKAGIQVSELPPTGDETPLIVVAPEPSAPRPNAAGTGPPKNKRPKTEMDGVPSNHYFIDMAGLLKAQQFDKAWESFVSIATGFLGSNDEEADWEKCNPIKVKSTWEGEEGPAHLGKLLSDQCHLIDQNIGAIVRRKLAGGNEEEDEELSDARAGRVVGIRLGSGCGKSHLLLEAPRLLSMPGIYVTYNLDQSLKADRQDPRASVLLRILLRLASISHAASDDILKSKFGASLLSINRSVLRQFAVHQLAKQAGNNGIFIGVDEVMELEKNRTIGELVSELGLVATEQYRTKKSSCYVFVTSLSQDPFYSSSGRAVIRWAPLRPGENAVEEILKQFLRGRSMEELRPIVIAAAGFHFRSIVFAAEALGDFAIPSVQTVLGNVCERWKKRVADDIIERIRAFTLSSCKGVSASVKAVEDYLDHTGAFPPALICAAFGLITRDDDGRDFKVDLDDPLYGLFNCEFAYTNDAKQLEQFGESYDLFRARQKLPVLSCRVKVNVSKGTEKSTQWFHDLEYPDGLTVSDDSLFETVGDNKNRQTIVSEAGKLLSKGKYYSPGKSNHPYVDRAFVARNDDEDCLVLVQDKVNDDVPNAVKALNRAATLMRDEHPDIEVLCILNAIGAGPRTKSQDSLKFPYVLVRETELSTFYSPHFAPVAAFIRQRHQIGELRRRSTVA